MKELSVGPKSLSTESKSLARRNPTKGLWTLLLLQDRLGKPREANGLLVARTMLRQWVFETRDSSGPLGALWRGTPCHRDPPLGETADCLLTPSEAGLL